MQAADNMRIARDNVVALDDVQRAYANMAVSLAPEEDWSVRKALQGGISDLFGGFGDANRMDAEKPIPERTKRVAIKGHEFDVEESPVAKGFHKMSRAIDAWDASVWYALQRRTDPGEYLPPESTAGRLAHDVLRSSPYTLYSLAQFTVTQAIANRLAPGSGFLAGSFAGAWTEAKQQAGRVYVEARRRGMSVEEAQQAAFNVRMQNMALLLVTDPIQNPLTTTRRRRADPTRGTWPGWWPPDAATCSSTTARGGLHVREDRRWWPSRPTSARCGTPPRARLSN